ncbi:MAG: PD-(D/E)XK motif protein [Sarcina sp.]
MKKVNEQFEKVQSYNSYIRVDATHQLEIFVGHNENGYKCLTILGIGEIFEIESSRAIDVKLTKDNNNRLNLTFVLLDSSVESIFYKFCEDLIETSRKAKKNNEIKIIKHRWDKWKELFKRKNINILDEIEVMGLIGELIFLDKFMIPKYGEIKAVKAWGGPLYTSKDFELESIWYEVKSILPKSLTCKISSLEQLDSDLIGYLTLIRLERVNEICDGTINLNNLVEKIENSIESFETKLLFKDKIGSLGYFYNEKYYNYNFYHKNIEFYEVNKNFPVVKRKNIPNDIVRISYEILIRNINKFLVDLEKGEDYIGEV